MRNLILIAALIYSNFVFSKDFGKYGSTYVITEPDILEGINKKLQNYQRSGKLEEFQKKYREEVKKQIKHPNRVLGITNAEETRIRKFDPTTELEEDIVIPSSEQSKTPIKPEKIAYKVLHKAGTKINPLDHMLFNEPLVFIDGGIEAQRDFANKYKDKNPLTKIILINGKPGIQRVGDKEYYYYFDQWGAYSSRFNIAVVPSILYQLNNEKVLTIEEVNLQKQTINNEVKQ